MAAAAAANRVRTLAQHLAVSSDATIEAELTYGSLTGEGTTRRCGIANGRDGSYDVEAHGFTLGRIDLQQTQGVDLYDITSGSAALYPLAEAVLRRTFPGCTRVLIFDHVLRNAEMAAKSAGTPMLSGGYGHRAHGDYTVRSGFTRMRQLLEPHATSTAIDAALDRRFAFVNVWVPLRRVQRDPLALLEWASQSPEDVQTIRLTYQHRQGEVYRVLPSEKHRWVHFPNMQPGECLVFKVFDSATDGRARFSLHSAVELPDTEHLPCRESVELRCAVLFGEGGESLAPSFVAPHLRPGSPDRIDDPPISVEALPMNTDW